MTTCIISQPRYLPVISYLQRYFNADIFVYNDVVQRQDAGVENRNKLFSCGGNQEDKFNITGLFTLNKGCEWFSIPIRSSRNETINNTYISNLDFIKKHKSKIIEHYKKHPFFSQEILDKYYKNCENKLKFTDFIIQTMKNIEEILNLKPNKILLASEINNNSIKNAFGTHKLREICKAVNANVYISGANGSVYGADEVFTKDCGVELKYNNPINLEYQQSGQEKFIPFMGLFDYLFCMGVDKVRKIVSSSLILTDN